MAGVIPLMFLVLFTINAFWHGLKFKTLKKGFVFKKLFVYVFREYNSSFLVEPVIEGMYLLFLLFCFFVGFLKGINNKKITN